jgi:hypothetical protein
MEVIRVCTENDTEPKIQNADLLKVVGTFGTEGLIPSSDKMLILTYEEFNFQDMSTAYKHICGSNIQLALLYISSVAMSSSAD